jgi:hypothetical protein
MKNPDKVHTLGPDKILQLLTLKNGHFRCGIAYINNKVHGTGLYSVLLSTGFPNWVCLPAKIAKQTKHTNQRAPNPLKFNAI